MDIQKAYLLDFPIQDVFDAWVSSKTVISPAQKMYIEPHLGGEYQLFLSADDTEPSARGVFSEILQNRRVVYSWEWHNDGETTEIAVDFSVDGRGTRIDLSHTGFTNQRSREMHNSGWDNYVSGLKAHLENNV